MRRENRLRDRTIRLKPGNLEKRIETARRLTALHREINRAMRIKITEPVFFFGEIRKPGDVIDVPLGPYRTEKVRGGLTRIPQFIEMPEEIKQVIVDAAAVPEPPVNPPAASFAEATVAALKPAAAKPKGNPLAARIRALTTRRAKFQDDAAAILGPAETAMTEVEANGPAILKRAAAASTDELTAITDLADSLKELDATNGNPLEG